MINYFLLQQYYFYGIAQVAGIVLLTLYFIFGIQSTLMHLMPLLVLYVPLVIWQQVIFLWLQKYNIDPKKESGLMLRAKLLNYAAWPIYFLAFVGVVRGKRLTYKVTPKGKEQKINTPLSLFLPHFVLGTITVIDIVCAFYTKHESIQLLFWIIINSIVMYYFVASVCVQKITSLLQKVNFSLPLSKQTQLAVN